MPKLVRVPMDIPDQDLLEDGVFLSKEDCKLLATELSHYGCFNEERREAYNMLMDLIFETAHAE